jgi:hypothetical protein
MYLSTVFLHSKERRLPIRALKFCQSLIVRIDSYYEEVLKLFNAYPSCTRYALHVSCKQFYSIARLSHSFHISRSLVSMARKFKRALTCISFGHAGLYRQSGVQSSTKVTSTAKIACIRWELLWVGAIVNEILCIKVVHFELDWRIQHGEHYASDTHKFNVSFR